MNDGQRFAILDIETMVVGERLPPDVVEKALASLGNPYFDRVVPSTGAVVMRKGTDIALIAEDGTLRVITKDKSVDETRDMYFKLIQVAQEVLKADAEKLELNVEVNAISHQSGRTKASDAMQEFVGRDKFKKLGIRMGGELTGLGLAILASDFGKNGSKERLEYDIEPLMSDPSKYYVRVRYQRRASRGLEFLGKIDEFAEKSLELVKLVEGG